MRVLLRVLLGALLPALGDAVRRACEGPAAKTYRFCDTTLPAEVRARDIVSRLKLSEKPALMTARHSAPVDRLGIPSYDWGVNSIHGDQVSCGTNCATNYPLPVAIGATLNMTLVYELANMMGVELRALRLEGACEQHRRLQSATSREEGHPSPPEGDACIGLDTWAPNLNLNRENWPDRLTTSVRLISS
jgi:beta-glucosidase-like glycosyl hydrolase